MNVNNSLRDRKLGLTRRVEVDFARKQIRLKQVVKLNSASSEPDDEQESSKTSGPLACSRIDSNILAVANEDGYVNLLHTTDMKDLGFWLAHENAIFDIKASYDRKHVFTGSGDATVRKWDLETKKNVLTISPHHSTVKSISVYDDNIIASGSRDGTIKIHDLRQKEPTIIVIRDAHRNRIIGKSRRTSCKTDPISCVTNVVFDPYAPRIYSTGANDATIKLWDIRRHAPMNKFRRSLDGQLYLNQPFMEVHHPSSGRHCGYSHLLISNCKIYAACSDNKIYCYENFGSTSEEPIKFTGYRYDTYLRLAVMDDRFLISGAKGGGAIVWSLGQNKSSIYYPSTTKQPIGQLKPDDKDRYDTNVIDTDWDSLSIITFRDDRLVCKWTLQHVLDRERKALASLNASATLDEDVTMQTSDILDVNVLRPSPLQTSQRMAA